MVADDKKAKMNEEAHDLEVEPQLEEEVETLACDVSDDDLRKQNLELNDCYKRLAAEYDNYRKRTAKEKADIYDLSVMEVTEKYLEVLDNIELALANSQGAQDEVLKGVMMIHKQFLTVLEKLGVFEIESLDAEFDPNLHDAVMIEENEEKAGKIVEVFKKGYIYKERVIRHSIVKVAR